VDVAGLSMPSTAHAPPPCLLPKHGPRDIDNYMSSRKDKPVSTNLTITESKEIPPLLQRTLSRVREDLRDSPYLEEAVRVLPVGGFRSAIGCIWNAVVDDLRNKITHRSLALFNKTLKFEREIKTYEDFQNLVSDDQLIDGAYQIGVIGWEASKVLRHAKETRHIFDGHPKSSDPSILKVLATTEDCIKYVLAEPYPAQIIDIDNYVSIMGGDTFDKNSIAIDNALSNLPDIYKNELIHRLFTAYIHGGASAILRSNIEFVIPILWNVLSKSIRIQVVARVDKLIADGDADRTKLGFKFTSVVSGLRYLSITARRYRVKPWIDALKEGLDQWEKENVNVRKLRHYAGFVPTDLLKDYVTLLTLTYVGTVGYSSRFSRTDFYADEAAMYIPDIFQKFDDSAAEYFVEAVRSNSQLHRRISSPVKFARLRTLATIVSERISQSFSEREFLEAMLDPSRDEEFFKAIGVRPTREA
jgi:hypothetical protein